VTDEELADIHEAVQRAIDCCRHEGALDEPAFRFAHCGGGRSWWIPTTRPGPAGDRRVAGLGSASEVLCMTRRPTALVVTTLGVLTCLAPSALANGIDLPTREAMQGDEIAVTGHAWLTCCPPNTRVEHVQLFLVEGPALEESQRVLLFDVAANAAGTISTVFTLPYVAPGRYRLEACGGLVAGGPPCLPEGRFTVLLGPPSPSPTASPAPGGEDPGWLLAMVALLVIGGATALAYFLKRRSP
jgi:hypothetical protein